LGTLEHPDAAAKIPQSASAVAMDIRRDMAHLCIIRWSGNACSPGTVCFLVAGETSFSARIEDSSRAKQARTSRRFDSGPNDGSDPEAGLLFDTTGDIYGTTFSGGQFNLGTVFELKAPADNGGYRERVLWNFNGADGSGPLGSVVLDPIGDLFGLTSTGGGKGCYGFEGCGVAFEVAP
jgi:hypothetical protein